MKRSGNLNLILSMWSKEGQIKDKLLFEDAVLMYNLCRYERARNPDSVSTWCAAFQEEDLMVTSDTNKNLWFKSTKKWLVSKNQKKF